MPPKRNARQATPPGSDEEDNGSVTSKGTQHMDNDAEQTAEEEATGYRDKIKDVVSGLDEKRGSTREAALSAFKKLASENVISEDLEDYGETLLSSFLRSMRKGSAAESTLAANSIGILFLALGADNERLVQEVIQPAQNMIRNSSVVAVQSSAADALAMACFVASTEPDTTTNCLKFFEEIFSRDYPNEVAESALEGWALLASTVSAGYIQHQRSRVMKALRKHLRSDNLELRLTAAETIAVLVEITKPPETEDDDEEEEDGEETNGYEDQDGDLLDDLKELAALSSRHVAKKDRAKQRSLLKDVVRFVEHGEPVELSLRFHRETVEFDSWAKVRQLDAIKKMIGPGLNLHAIGNPVVRAIFGLFGQPDLSEVERLSAREKRSTRSPNSAAAKARSKQLSNQRRQRTAFVGDGDD